MPDTDILESTEKTQATNAVEGDLTFSMGDLIEERMKFHGDIPDEDPKPTDEEPDPEQEPEEEDPEREPEPTEEAEDEQDVLSQASDDWEKTLFDHIGELDDEKLKTLGKSLQSKLLTRYGKKVRQLKELEEKLQSTPQEEAPAAAPEDATKSVYSKATTEAELLKLQKTQQGMIDAIENILDDADGLGNEDVAWTDPEGKDYTKKELKQLKRDAVTDMRNNFTRQHAVIQANAQNKVELEQLESLAAQDLPWTLDDSTEQHQAYASLESDPLVSAMRKTFPMYTARIDFMLKHAVNSIKGSDARKALHEKGKKAAQKTPPIPGTGSAAGVPKRGSSDLAAQMKEAQARFAKTQSEADLANLLNLEHQLTK